MAEQWFSNSITSILSHQTRWWLKLFSQSVLSSILASLIFVGWVTYNKEQEPGPIILAGGGEMPSQVISWFKQRAPTGRYLVITCHADEYGQYWRDLLGEVEFVLPEDFAKQSLDGVSAVVVAGGDQWDYISRLSGEAIQKAHEKGILLMGTSAGAMIMGEHYFSAEQGSINSEQAANGDGVCLGQKFVIIGCLKGLIIDTHFRQRNRDGRLRIFVSKSGAVAGLGIDEETALCIDHKESLILGKGGVTILPRR